MTGLSYSRAGVDQGAAARETGALGKILKATLALRPDTGRNLLPHPYYASALRINDDLALGLCTDGVGSKIVVGEQMGKLDTIGIDCIAMNVNDLVCIGAEPIAMVDYIGVETLAPGLMEDVARGLAEGARQANISIPGGETAQLPDIVKGLDLVGTAVGLAPMSRLNWGKDVAPGQVVIAIESSGIHANGLTLARKALFDAGGLSIDSEVAELGRTVGAELLEPTRIYVKEAMALFDAGVPVKALCHITGDGLLNLNRVGAPVGFEIDALPPAPPIFDLIQKLGRVETAEMYAVFNMGIGLCIVVEEDWVDRVCEMTPKTHVIGRVVESDRKSVALPQMGLLGTGTEFATL